jgi:D-alanyl-D-alanine carboxypeptidase (penicillin-binding protein 5/6)
MRRSHPRLKTEVVLDDKVSAPIAKGQKVGAVEIYAGDQHVGTVDAVAAGDIPEGGVLSVIGITDETAKVIERIFASILILIVLLFAAYVALKRRQIRRRKLRRKERSLRYQDQTSRHRYDEHWRY